MSSYIEFMSGAAAGDDTNAPVDDNTGIRFPADGSEYKCGWTKYVPNEINNKTAKTFTLYFIDPGGIGNIQLDFEWYAVNSSGSITASGSYTELVAGPDNANTIFGVDINVTTWFADTPKFIVITMTRDSSNANDTFPNAITYATGLIQ